MAESHAIFMLMICFAIATYSTGAIAQSIPAGCEGKENTFPIWEGEPKLLKSCDNGKLLLAQAENGAEVKVLHLFGSPEQAGEAQATLLKEEIFSMFDAFEQYMEDEIGQYLQFLPKDIRDVIEKDGITAALDFEVALTKPHWPAHYLEEMQGMSKVLSVGKDDQLARIERLSMFPELIKAHCTILGAWGQATAKVKEPVVQLRALDFGLDNPLSNYSMLVVYHPEEGHPFATVTWAGFIGSVTAYSPHVGVSEKVWLKYNLTSSRAGIPFHFLIRDIAQFDKNVDDALNRIYNNDRTCSIFLGLGSSDKREVRILEYSYEGIMVFDDFNFPAYGAHTLKEGLVYVDKHTQPSQHPCLPALIDQTYGSLSAETIIRKIVGITGSGDMHAAVYDYIDNLMYLSLSGKNITSTSTDGAVMSDPTPAHARPWFKFNMTTFFNEPSV